MDKICSKDINLTLRRVTNVINKNKKSNYFIPECLLNSLCMLSKILVRYDLNNIEKRQIVDKINNIIDFIDHLNIIDRNSSVGYLKRNEISEMNIYQYELVCKIGNNGVSYDDELEQEEISIAELFGDSLGFALSLTAKKRKRV